MEWIDELTSYHIAKQNSSQAFSDWDTKEYKLRSLKEYKQKR